MKTKPYEMLHCHTISSDGKLDCFQILKLCERLDIGVVAFTDHDAVINNNLFSKLKNESSPVNWISGIEISSTGPHIIGLFIDSQNPDILDHCQKAQKARVNRMRMMVENLNKIGFRLTDEDCLKASKGEAVGRPHIIEALLGYESNLKIIEDLKKKMEEESLKDKDIRAKYLQMLKRGERDYPYCLFLDENSFVKGIYVDNLYEITVEESTNLIRKAGGVAFLAHWFTDKRKIGYEKLEGMLSENSLDGIETLYGLGVLTPKTILAQNKRLKELLQKYSKLESGGSDAHSEEDFRLFSKSKWFSEMTVGMTEKIIKYSKAEIKNSSFLK